VTLAQSEEVLVVDHDGALLPVGLVRPAAVVRWAGLGGAGRDQRQLGAREPGDHDGGLPRSRAHLLPSGPGSSWDAATKMGAGGGAPSAPTHARPECP
jgi:hypothetical protein